jgi:glycosyltransferase involved in cell wall biosynthesis
MKVLLISASAPPMNSPESIQVGRYLNHLAINHEVTLVTSKISGGWEPSDERVNEYLKNVFQIIRLKTLHARAVSLIKKIWPRIIFPDDSAAFAWQTKRVLKSITNKPQIIVSRAAPFSSSALALKLSKHFNIPWVMHLSDPWVDSPFLIVPKARYKRLQNLESECVKHAHTITLTSQQTIDFYKRKYPQWSYKFKFLPNVFDEDDLNTSPIDFNNTIRFVFTGRLYGNRSVNRWIDAIEIATAQNPEIEIKCEFILAGFFVDANIKRIRKSKLSNIKYIGPVSLKEASHVQRSATVLIAIDAMEEDDERYNLFFPSKLLDYFAAGRKIIAITGMHSTTHQVIDGKYGWCFNQNSINQLPSFIIQVVKKYENKDKSFFEVSSDFTEFAAKQNAERLNQMVIEALGHAH